MKKILHVLPLLLMLLAASFPVTSAQASQDIYPEQLTYYDAQVDVLLPFLDTFQADYFAINERYYQALESHSTIPSVPTIPDGINNSPTDQPETLAYFWTYAGLPETLAWSFRIDTYSGPEGDGYVLTVSTLVNSEVWRCEINHGPETWRDADWYLVEGI